MASVFENVRVALERDSGSTLVSQSSHNLHRHAWIDNETNESIVVISDNLNPTKHGELYITVQFIFRHRKANISTTETIDVFSNGATSQFKQRFIFSHLRLWQMKLYIQLTRSFFVTSHGKGVVDGIGGTVKITVWRHIKEEKSHATNAQEYASLVKELFPHHRCKIHSKE